MKPLFLKMTAFGPFSDSVEISFDRVFDGGLFLIHGRTGAGKTSILDGICFALFGRPSSEEREKDLSSIRSDAAAADLMTEVDLVFAIGGEAYRVHRVPAQKRPKKRAAKNGDASTDFRGSAELYKLASSANDIPSLRSVLLTSKDIEQLSWQPIAGKMEAVKAAVESLIGMDEKQFRQVIVLPQGRFREFLSSSSTERQAILEKLFQTDRFSRFQAHVTSQSRALESGYKESSQKLETRLRASGLQNFVDISPLRESLIENNKILNEELSIRRNRIDRLNQEHHRAAEAEKTKNRKSQLETEYRQLENQSAEMARKKSELIRFSAWSPYFQIASALNDTENKRDRIETGLNLCAESIQKISAQIDFLKTEEFQKKQQSPNLEEMNSELNRLRDVARILKDVENLKKDVVENEKQVEHTASLVSYHELQKRTLTDALVELGRKLVALDRRISREDALHVATEERRLQKLELQFHQNEVVRLAAQLKVDEPCPVCGSRTHPAPAQWIVKAPNENPESIQNQISESHLAEERLKIDELKIKTAESGSRRRAKLEILKTDDSDDEMGGDDSTFKSMWTDYEDHSQRIAHIDRDLAKAVADLSFRKQNSLSIQSSLDQKYLGLSKDDRDLDAVIRRGIELKKSQETLELNLKTLTGKISDAQSELSRNRGAQETLALELEKIKKELSDLREKKQMAFQKATQARTDIEVPTRIINETEALGFQSETQAHDLNLQKIAAALEEIRSMTNSLVNERPLSEIQIEQETVQNRRNELESAIAQNNVQIENLTRLEREYQSELVQLESLKLQAERAGRIAGLLAGDRSQNKLLVPLARFALQSRFEDVLEQANRRLTIMSRGQYLLRRPALSSNLRDSQGLELSVEDALTGRERHAGSLSGGESFMAALSLALGLADVVQADLGGLRLDTVLIDEGFGTLDAESLDLAIRTLIDLQSGGRFVGIISHVQELKSQIQNQLEVTKSPSGSRVRWSEAHF